MFELWECAAGDFRSHPDAAEWNQETISFGDHQDMPHVFDFLIKTGHDTTVFPICEYWLDIGQLEDYDRANSEFAKNFKSPSQKWLMGKLYLRLFLQGEGQKALSEKTLKWSEANLWWLGPLRNDKHQCVAPVGRPTGILRYPTEIGILKSCQPRKFTCASYENRIMNASEHFIRSFSSSGLLKRYFRMKTCS